MSRASAVVLLLPLLALPARGDLTLVGEEIPIAEDVVCPISTDEVAVVATPKGAFEAMWVSEDEFAVMGRRFDRRLVPPGPATPLLPLYGGLFPVRFAATWAGGYQLAVDVADFNQPSDPAAAFRLRLDLAGNLLAPARRMDAPHFVRLVPDRGGESLRLRVELPIYGPTSCQSRGVLARRLGADGSALSAESRATRRASAWNGGEVTAVRTGDGRFALAWSTCERFVGVVMRRLQADGSPGKAFDFPLPARVGSFAGGSFAVAARDGAMAFAAAVALPDGGAPFVGGVSGTRRFGPVRLESPLPFAGIVDLAAAPGGGYLLLYEVNDGEEPVLLAQELDAAGQAVGGPLAMNQVDLFRNGAVTHLTDGRWLAVLRLLDFTAGNCQERVVARILSAD
jgi:hypothetical protein